MSTGRLDFTYASSPEPHRERTKQLLKSHPEVRALIGQNPYSFFIIVAIVAGQTALAILLSRQPWWLSVIVAYGLGAFANHTLFVLIHECSHNLVFKRKVPNILAGILADLAMVIPTSVSFRSYHLNHHSYLGEYALDADLPYRWEARLVGSGFVGKALWLFFFPVFQGLRPIRLKKIPFITGWTVVNWIAVFAYDAIVVALFGPVALLYLALSLFFSIGLHPLGARWIQEHYLTFPPQETYGYYGPLNAVALNVGFHNEHHDIPSVPWNNLPKLKRAAPEMYGGLVAHTSWSRLLWRFLTDRTLSLYSRIVRNQPVGTPA